MRHRSTPKILLSLLVSLGLAAPATVALAGEKASEEATDEATAVSLAAMFEGAWNMKGRFRWNTQMDWIPTGSSLVARPMGGDNFVVRDIVAPQIDFEAVDMLVYNPETHAAQYFYVSNQEPRGYLYEGACKDGCRTLEFTIVCGPTWGDRPCLGRSTITFETDDRFVARDFLQFSEESEEFMSREVYYTRAGSE